MMAGLAIALVLVVIGIVAMVNKADSVDKTGMSYRLGQEWGNSIAGAALRRGSPLPLIANDFEAECDVRTREVESEGIHGGAIELSVDELDADDYRAGCMDGVQQRLERDGRR